MPRSPLAQRRELCQEGRGMDSTCDERQVPGFTLILAWKPERFVTILSRPC